MTSDMQKRKTYIYIERDRNEFSSLFSYMLLPDAYGYSKHCINVYFLIQVYFCLKNRRKTKGKKKKKKRKKKHASHPRQYRTAVTVTVFTFLPSNNHGLVFYTLKMKYPWTDVFFLLILLLKNFAEHSFLGELTDVTFWFKQVVS